MSLDLTLYAKFLAALLFVLTLIGGIALLARRFGLGGAVRLAKGRRRIEILEVLALDPKRRLMLIKRDDREHLLLLGAHNDLVIDTGVASDGAVRRNPPDNSPSAFSPASEPS